MGLFTFRTSNTSVGIDIGTSSEDRPAQEGPSGPNHGRDSALTLGNEGNIRDPQSSRQ